MYIKTHPPATDIASQHYATLNARHGEDSEGILVWQVPSYPHLLSEHKKIENWSYNTYQTTCWMAATVLGGQEKVAGGSSGRFLILSHVASMPYRHPWLLLYQPTAVVEPSARSTSDFEKRGHNAVSSLLVYVLAEVFRLLTPTYHLVPRDISRSIAGQTVAR